MEYTWALATGFQLAAGAMAFGLALAVIVGRCITADETWYGVLLRGAVLTGLGRLVLTKFGTAVYWLLLPLAAVPLVDVWFGASLTARRYMRDSEVRLREAVVGAADQPTNPVLRIALGRALLETGQIEAGLTALDEAVRLAAESEGHSLLSAMAAEVRQRFVHVCPSCGHPSPSQARVCRHCWAALTDGRLLRATRWLWRAIGLRFRNTA
jgi:ribosomal protein L40E